MGNIPDYDSRGIVNEGTPVDVQCKECKNLFVDYENRVTIKGPHHISDICPDCIRSRNVGPIRLRDSFENTTE